MQYPEYLDLFQQLQIVGDTETWPESSLERKMDSFYSFAAKVTHMHSTGHCIELLFIVMAPILLTNTCLTFRAMCLPPGADTK